MSMVMMVISLKIKFLVLTNPPIFLLDLVHPIRRGHVEGLTLSLYLAPPLVLNPPLMLNGRRWKRMLLGNALLNGVMMHTLPFNATNFAYYHPR